VNVERAVAAATATGTALGLTVDAVDLLHTSNRVTVRLAPCDVVVRVSPGEASWTEGAAFQLDIAARLAAAGAPVELLADGIEPRVHEHDGLALTFWRYHAPIPPADLEPAEYADALARLHAAMVDINAPSAPHFTDRVADAERTLTDHERSPDVTDDDRDLLLTTLRRTSDQLLGRDEQLLHGEPHPGNVLRTRDGLLFVDLETCCRGPVAFDVVHAPEEIADHYPGLDPVVLRTCRTLMLAMIVTWRCDRDDNLPNGQQLRAEWMTELRSATGS
jgi:Ser/Thr protein kinase RdoA (MazF antagonist)